MFEALQNYFDTIPSLHRALILAGGITFFWLVESIVPLFNFKYSKTKHAAINIFFTLTTIVINFGFAFLTVKTSDWVVGNHFGLLQWVSLSPLLSAMVGLLLLDFIVDYLVHMI